MMENQGFLGGGCPKTPQWNLQDRKSKIQISKLVVHTFDALHVIEKSTPMNPVQHLVEFTSDKEEAF